MGKYYVEVPIVVKLMVGIDDPEINSEQEAIEAVFSADIHMLPEDRDGKFDFVDGEWNMYEKVVQGNVYHGGINEPWAEKEEEDEDDE